MRTQLKTRLADHPTLLKSARRARRALRGPARRRQVRRSRAADARLVPSPVFVICGVRSGSTLLRVLLNSHPAICAPHELHLRFTRVSFDKPYAEVAMKELHLDRDELEHLLWDRVLHRQLVRSGKRVLVDKTPANATHHERLLACWPKARFIFLLRHPASVVASLMESRPDRELAPTIREALTYLNGVEEARQAHPGLVVRYEDLTADPATVTKQICAYLGVRWDSHMLEYGRSEHGKFRAGIGDWSIKIRTGSIQPGRPLPEADEVHEDLRPLAKAWGYLP
ncbi:sulfotransferase [Actinopolymorpha sp. B17G11]|uniref:sulfotransferase family protein n=1 Tax=Actinopolymorpha sp. B17G11 TaxID=3160861 RepID=UPI0032E39E73